MLKDYNFHRMGMRYKLMDEKLKQGQPGPGQYDQKSLVNPP